VLVPVVAVGGVTVAVVDVVDVVVVRNGLVPAAVAVLVLVVGMGDMRQLALIPMIVVGEVSVTLVDVIGMSFVLHLGVAAVGTVLVSVVGVGGVTAHALKDRAPGRRRRRGRFHAVTS